MATATATSSSSTSKQQQQHHHQNILVCGGGVIGACTAYYLSQHPNYSPTTTTITLIEKSSIACAASGKAGGFLALDWSDSTPLSSLSRASFHLHRSLSSLLHGPTLYSYRPLHTLSLSLPTSTSSSTLPSWIDMPVGNPTTIGTPDTTAQLHPQLFTKALLSAVKDRVNVVMGEVERVVVLESGRCGGVVLKDGRVVEGGVVVLAMGPWMNCVEVVRSLFRVSGMKAHSIVVRPREEGVVTPHALFLSYRSEKLGRTLDPEVYPRPTGEVYICGMSREEEVPDNPEEIVGDSASIEMLHEIAGAVSSHLKKDSGAEVVAEQACFLPCTDDGLPVIGEIPGVSGCFVATGHSCWGILNGPATGKSLAELILDGKSTTVDLTPFSPARFLRGRRK